DCHAINVNVKGAAFVGGAAGVLQNGYISGVMVINSTAAVTVEGSGSNVGGIAGQAGGDVSDCHVINVGVKGAGNVGGAIGDLRSGAALYGVMVAGTVAEIPVTVSGTGANIGGVAGQAAGGVTDCHAVDVGVKGTNYVGGAVGFGSAAISGVTVTGVAAGVTVEGSGSCVGGVAGQSGVSVSNCQTAGISVKGGGYVGGIAGQATGGVNDCLAEDVAVKGASYIGGAVGAGNSFISGVTVKDAEVESTGSYIGGVAGRAVSSITGCIALNVRVAGAGTMPPSNQIGGIAGQAMGNVDGCRVAGSAVASAVGGAQIGGVVGALNGAAIAGCMVDNTTVSGSSMVGGILGNGVGAAKILDVCFVSAAAHGSPPVSGSAAAGGILGSGNAVTVDRALYIAPAPVIGARRYPMRGSEIAIGITGSYYLHGEGCRIEGDNRSDWADIPYNLSAGAVVNTGGGMGLDSPSISIPFLNSLSENAFSQDKWRQDWGGFPYPLPALPDGIAGMPVSWPVTVP
ncbi:MAG: hypothetical protein FWH06_02955, partial [Oscillospiraceae bacterium]|nr:hypothetical protein [Oscillospiraceae bacterium]